MAKSVFKQNIVKGTSRNDTLEGGAGPDRLVGGAGDDWLVAAWDDIANTPSGVLIYDGGQGRDTLDFSKLDRPIGVDLYFGPYILPDYNRDLYGDRIHFNPDPDTRLKGAVAGIENIIGTEFADYLQGSIGDNYIHGRGGNDYISSQRGNDIVIGGDGNDYIVLGNHSSTVSGDDDNDPSATGNDIFHIGGNDAGIYSVHRITDFDLRTDAADTSFDKLYFSSYQTITWGANAAGELVAYRWAQQQKIGEVIFSGITSDHASMIEVHSYQETATGPIVTPYFPEWGF